MKKGFNYSGKCDYCGEPLRPLFAEGKGKRARRQRPGWVTCDNGHQTKKKRKQV